MKILLATTSHVSVILLRGQFKFLNDQGIEVAFCSSNSDKTRRLVESEGGDFHPINFNRTISPIKDLICLYKCIRLIFKLKPDIINAGTPKAGLLFMIAGFLTGVKIRIFTLRGLRSIEMTGLSKSIMLFMEKLSMFLSTKTIAISPSLKQFVVDTLGFSEEKIIVLKRGSSNGIDIKRFDYKSIDNNLISQLKKENNIKDSRFTLGYVGRIVNDKGLRELIDVFLEIDNNFQLVLIGDRGEEDTLSLSYFEKIKKSEHIHYLEAKSNIEEYFPIFDLLILYSYREGFGNVVIEAAAMGIPAIVSDIIGARDTIVDYKTGWLVEPKNKESLKSKILEVTSDLEKLNKIGKNAKKHVICNFSNEQIWNEQLSLYKELCAIK